MFIAESGECPDIFTDRTLTPTDIESINLKNKMDYVFFHDVIELAKVKNNLNMLSELDKKLVNYMNEARERHNKKPSRYKKLKGKIKKIICNS